MNRIIPFIVRDNCIWGRSSGICHNNWVPGLWSQLSALGPGIWDLEPNNNNQMILFSKYQKKIAPPPHSIWRDPLHFIGCGFGAGAFPYFPGTIGTLAAVPLVLLLGKMNVWFYIITCVILFLIGIYLCDRVNRDFGTNDHPAVVYDELATFPVTMIAIPTHWYFLLIAFVLFLLTDTALLLIKHDEPLSCQKDIQQTSLPAFPFHIHQFLQKQ